MDTVFFLGAGASHGSDFRLPLMDGFFDEESLKNYSNLKNYIRKLNPKNPLEKVNMESIITHMELTLEGFGSSWTRPDYTIFEARKEFTNYVVNRLGAPVGEKVCNKHLKLFEKLDSTDTILSLNYDSIVGFCQ